MRNKSPFFWLAALLAAVLFLSINPHPAEAFDVTKNFNFISMKKATGDECERLRRQALVACGSNYVDRDDDDYKICVKTVKAHVCAPTPPIPPQPPDDNRPQPLTPKQKCQRSGGTYRRGKCQCPRGQKMGTTGICIDIQEEKQDPCQKVTCPTHGFCRNGVCQCNTGYRMSADNKCNPDYCLTRWCGAKVKVCQGNETRSECVCQEGFAKSLNNKCVCEVRTAPIQPPVFTCMVDGQIVNAKNQADCMQKAGPEIPIWLYNWLDWLGIRQWVHLIPWAIALLLLVLLLIVWIAKKPSKKGFLASTALEQVAREVAEEWLKGVDMGKGKKAKIKKEAALKALTKALQEPLKAMVFSSRDAIKAFLEGVKETLKKPDPPAGGPSGSGPSER